MSSSFDSSKLMSSILHEVAKSHKFEVHCPKCTYYVWDYTASEMKELGVLYCNYCEEEIEIKLDPLLQ